MKTLSKYVFEVIVIFIGITISFIFEEWRSSRQDSQKEQEYYSMILRDIKSDSADLARVLEGIAFEQPRMDSMLTSNYKKGGQFPLDMCAAFAFIQTQNLLRSFESIRTSGDVKLLTSIELVNTCNSILTQQASLNHMIRAEEEKYGAYRDYLARNYPDMSLFCARYQSNVKKGKISNQERERFLSDPRVMIYYNDLRWISEGVKRTTGTLQGEIKKLEALLAKTVSGQ